jgi:hypothetical protein
MRRRHCLRAAGALLPAALAGCLGLSGNRVSNAVAETPTARLSMDAVPDAELPRKVLYTVHAGDETERLIDGAVDGGTTAESIREPPLPEQRHLFYQSREEVYELDHEVVEETPGTTYSVKVDILQRTPDESEVVQFADLPAVDREQFERKGLADGDPVGIGTTFYYTDAERDRSRLVPDPDVSAIEWADGTRAEWVVDGAHGATLTTYRYTGELVATAAEYARRMREQFGFELADLSSAQREIVETAVEEHAYVVDAEATPEAPFRSLTDRFRDQQQARGLDERGDGDLSGTYLVRYDGAVYWTGLLLRGTPTETPA